LPPLWQGWTSSHRIATDALLDLGSGAVRWRLDGAPDDLSASTSGATHRIQMLGQAGSSAAWCVSAVIDGRPVTATVARDRQHWWWLYEGIELDMQDLRLTGAGNQSQASAGALRAPMHGRVTQVLAEDGAAVQAGAVLLVMEAMKMEHQIVAPHAGKVTTMLARVGEQVSARQLLVELVP
jgi:acetyl/propionyl-CoA carboxylase alpha subunit